LLHLGGICVSGNDDEEAAAVLLLPSSLVLIKLLARLLDQGNGRVLGALAGGGRFSAIPDLRYGINAELAVPSSTVEARSLQVGLASE